MRKIEVISTDLAEELCRKVTADLPEYFGLPDANEHYAIGVRSRINLAAKMDEEYECIIAALSCLRTGFVYLPLDSNLPLERLELIKEETQFLTLITSSDKMKKLSALKAKIIVIDQWKEIKYDGQIYHDMTRRNHPQNPQSLAYVIYTSGSTGRPKGAANTHQGLMNRILWMKESYKIDAQDVILNKTNCSFDVSVWEIFGPLISGACIVTVPAEGNKDVTILAALIQKFKVSIVHFVPSVLREFLYYATEIHCKSLRQLFVGGEKFDTDLLERCFKLVPNVSNVYGPAEAAIDVTHFRCLRNSTPFCVPIGLPIDNIRIYVLGANLQFLPPELPGEIYLSGIGLGRGYLNRPGLTAERFIPDPFSPISGERMYQTGDLGYYNKRGEVVYLGRADFQVKIRGYRVELQEIENILKQSNLIKMAIVLVSTSEQSPKLIAYVIKNDEQKSINDNHNIAESLLLLAKAKLPHYMVPSDIIFIDKIPITRNGKLDRQALQSLYPDQLRTNHPIIPEDQRPFNAIESQLQFIWSEILKIDIKSISLFDCFFKKGGHSLNAMRLIVHIRRQFEIDFSIRAAFEHSTLEAMATHISHLLKMSSDTIPILQNTHLETYPLSFAQQRIWFLEQLFPNKCVYHIPIIVRLKGNLNVAAITAAIDKVVEAHSILSVVFSEQGGVPYQKVLENNHIVLNVSNLKKISKSKKEELLQNELKSLANSKFDFTKPLFRANLFMVEEDDSILAMTLHHIVGDALSVEIILNDLALFYNSYQKTDEALSQGPTFSYMDFIVWQKSWLKDEHLEQQLLYWKNKLANLPGFFRLPFAKQRPLKPSHEGRYYSFSLKEETVQNLKALGAERQATLFMVLLSGFKVLLNYYTDNKDIVIGTPIANRHYAGVEKIVGFFANTLVLRTELSIQSSFAELLFDVRKTSLEAYQHQDIPFEVLVDHLKIERDISFHPCFQIMFGFYKSSARVKFEGLSGSLLMPDYPVSKFDLTLMCEENETGELNFTLEYATDLFFHEDIVSMANLLSDLYDFIAKNPNNTIYEYRSYLGGVVSAAHPSPCQGFPNTFDDRFSEAIHHLFEKKALEIPNAIAASCSEESIGYGDLNIAGNKLAHKIIENSPHSSRYKLIALYTENKLNTLKGIIAILKAGRGYLILDHKLPLTRLKLLLKESRVETIICDRPLAPNFAEFFSMGNVIDFNDLDKYSSANPDIPITANDIAYCLFTSGTSGNPKGVLVTHGNLVNSTLARLQYYPDPVHQYLLLSPFHFDSSVAGIFWSLLTGAELVIPASYDFEVLRSILNEDKLTHILLTPSLYIELLNNIQNSRRPGDTKKYNNLSTLILAGEAIPPNMYEKHRELFTLTKLYNEYGPTENCVWSTVYELSRTEHKEEREQDLNIIGKSVKNTMAYLLNDDLLPVFGFGSGQIYLAGNNLSIGYINDPALTAEKFVPNPFSHEPGSRLYKTGDLGQYTSNGNIRYLGRQDEQIKINGIRIEAREIESVLNKHIYVRECVVFRKTFSLRKKQLVAYIVPDFNHIPRKDYESNQTLSDVDRNYLRSNIASFLAEELPQYMQPSQYIFLEFLPRNSNGKVDKNILSEIQINIDSNAKIAPRNEVEFRIVKIIAEILGVSSVAVNENLFQAGANSLTLLVISSQIKKEFKKTIQISEIFRSPTVEKIAEKILLLLEEPNIIQKPIIKITKGDNNPDSTVDNNAQRLYLVHPALGLAFPYTSLADYKHNKSIYGISNPYFGQKEPYFTSIEQMASHYIQYIERHSFDSLELGGWSFGGVVAFEMACQLSALGSPPNRLLLIDSHNFSAYDQTLLDKKQLDRELEHYITLQGVSTTSEIGQRLKSELMNNFKLNKSYSPRSYSGNVVLLKATKIIEGKTILKGKPDNGWGAIIKGNLTIKEISETHEQMFNYENVKEVANEI